MWEKALLCRDIYESQKVAKLGSRTLPHNSNKSGDVCSKKTQSCPIWETGMWTFAASPLLLGSRFENFHNLLFKIKAKNYETQKEGKNLL